MLRNELHDGAPQPPSCGSFRLQERTTMPKKTGTAREFVLKALRQHADRELRVADLHDLAGGQYKTGNIDLTLRRLLVDGKVTKTIDPDRSVWWAIT